MEHGIWSMGHRAQSQEHRAKGEGHGAQGIGTERLREVEEFLISNPDSYRD